METNLTLPTLDQLNEASCSHNQLLLLRTLCTSDLAFAYMVLKDDTLRDLLKTTKDLLTEGELSPEETTEFNNLWSQIDEYLGRTT